MCTPSFFLCDVKWYKVKSWGTSGQQSQWWWWWWQRERTKGTTNTRNNNKLTKSQESMSMTTIRILFVRRRFPSQLSNCSCNCNFFTFFHNIFPNYAFPGTANATWDNNRYEMGTGMEEAFHSLSIPLLLLHTIIIVVVMPQLKRWGCRDGIRKSSVMMSEKVRTWGDSSRMAMTWVFPPLHNLITTADNFSNCAPSTTWLEPYLTLGSQAVVFPSRSTRFLLFFKGPFRNKRRVGSNCSTCHWHFY